jgi:hypothetical protein
METAQRTEVLVDLIAAMGWTTLFDILFFVFSLFPSFAKGVRKRPASLYYGVSKDVWNVMMFSLPLRLLLAYCALR